MKFKQTIKDSFYNSDENMAEQFGRVFIARLKLIGLWWLGVLVVAGIALLIVS